MFAIAVPMTKFSGLIFCLLLSTSCAVGNKYALHTVHADLDAAGDSKVAVATLDARVAVQDGRRPPHWVGQQRGGYGNPFAVGTASRKPLADDISRSVSLSLKDKGFMATPVVTAHELSADDARAALLQQGASRSILITVNKWKSDTYQNVGLSYVFSLQVYDDAGNPVARSEVEADENLGGSFWNPPAHARRVVPTALKRALEKLLNDPAVVAALR